MIFIKNIASLSSALGYRGGYTGLTVLIIAPLFTRFIFVLIFLCVRLRVCVQVYLTLLNCHFAVTKTSPLLASFPALRFPRLTVP